MGKRFHWPNFFKKKKKNKPKQGKNKGKNQDDISTSPPKNAPAPRYCRCTNPFCRLPRPETVTDAPNMPNEQVPDSVSNHDIKKVQPMMGMKMVVASKYRKYTEAELEKAHLVSNDGPNMPNEQVPDSVSNHDIKKVQPMMGMRMVMASKYRKYTEGELEKAHLVNNDGLPSKWIQRSDWTPRSNKSVLGPVTNDDRTVGSVYLAERVVRNTEIDGFIPMTQMPLYRRAGLDKLRIQHVVKASPKKTNLTENYRDLARGDLVQTDKKTEQIQEETMSNPDMQKAIDRLETVAARLENLAQRAQGSSAGGAGSQAAPDVVSPFVGAFDDLLKGQFAQFQDLSSKIGGEVQTQANMVKVGFKSVRDFLQVVSKSKKPSQTDLVELLTPISAQISSVQEYREKNRGGKLFNHLSGISESIPALGWVTVEPTPGPFVKEMSDAGMFYTNRVIKDFKDVDKTHVDWTKAWLGTLRELQAYIKEYHTTGLSWNPQGGDAKSAGAAKAPAAPGGAPAPPPPGPPPPPPPPVADLAPMSEGSGQPDARAALFADLNKGEGVTSGLKKVTDDMKTHKNPALKAQSTVPGHRSGPAPFKAPAGPPKTAPKPASKNSPPPVKPPVFELQMKKWVIEHQKDNKSMVIDNCNLKQTVYMYQCENSTLVIKGKVNSITLDCCKKVAVAFDDVVSSIEFINSKSIQAQVFGKCPTVSIDKTDGCQMYLSKDSLEAEIVTAKSSEMNILVPKDDGDFDEFPLPEQYKTTWNGKKFVTNVTESV